METRNCQNCKQDFEILDEDFQFYAKLKVPAPTFCPPCRLQRRLIWMKGLQLFKRKCDLCGEMKFSMYRPDAPYVIYCNTCWWSDNWDARDFAREYDPKRTFFEQWNELLHTAPLLGLSIDKISGELSPYTNHVGRTKDSYLVYYSDDAENAMYGYQISRSKNVCDSSSIMDSQDCYDCSHVYRSYNMVGTIGNNRSSYDSFFIRDCEGVHHSFGANSVHNGSYIFMGEQLGKEGYDKKRSGIDLGSYAQYQHWKNKAAEYFKTVPPRPVWDSQSVDVSGSYVFHSKNVKESFDVCDSEDSKFLMLIKTGTVKNSYDYTDWGENADRIYEGMTVGEDAYDVRFTHESGHGISYIEYSKLAVGGSHQFGCVSIKKPEYCILNKQYSKEEFEKLRAKIIDDMDVNPYTSLSGHTYRYGEFFPPEFSPHAYNDTFASRLFPLSKTEAGRKGFGWYEPEEKEYAITLRANDLPDNIKDADDSILKEVIGCGKCGRGFRIISQEIQFLRKGVLPLPRTCPFCRIWSKIDIWVANMTLHDRVCTNCGADFKTHYSQEAAPVIFCKECYRKEIL